MSTLKTLALCLTLQIGAFCGVPIRPADIEAALKLNQNAAVMLSEEATPELPGLSLPDLPE
jgi:hypothetical protein